MKEILEIPVKAKVCILAANVSEDIFVDFLLT
jgi:hypothetical protein